MRGDCVTGNETWLRKATLSLFLVGSLSAIVLLARYARTDLLPIAAIATIALLSWQILRQTRLARNDVESVVEALDNIARGNFDIGANRVRVPELGEIENAVSSMAQSLKSTIEGLHEVAQRDVLTGMANRNHFERTVERLLATARPGSTSCLMFLDIDGFKAVNDTLGHNFGDRLLQIAAERLKLATRFDELYGSEDRLGMSSAILGRFGGDEFTVFLADIPSDEVAHKIAKRVLRVLSEPFELGAHVTSVGASIGMAYSPRHADGYGELLRAADTAMYHAKRSGRNRIEEYCRAFDEETRRLAEQEQELRAALANGQFELHFQPLYDCRTLKISSAEALIRWRHPVRGLVLPGEFIPLAERSNLINQIGEWVVSEAVRRIAIYADQGRPLRISVNVSPNQLEQMEFIALVKSSLQRWKAPPHLLELEITESVAMQDCDLAADRLTRLGRLGVSIAIDDFGTGYSNLASLIRLPFSRVKIDRSLLDDLIVRPEARILVQTIISMANSLGFHSVAEGVESREQLDLLSVMGCDVVQGYLLSRPISEEKLQRLIFSSEAVSDGKSRSTLHP